MRPRAHTQVLQEMPTQAYVFSHARAHRPRARAHTDRNAPVHTQTMRPCTHRPTMRPRAHRPTMRPCTHTQVLQEMPTQAPVGAPGGGAPPPEAARAQCHRDAVMAMASAEGAQRVLLTAGRDGVVKAWR